MASSMQHARADWYRDPELLLGELARGGIGFSEGPAIDGYGDFREIRRGGQGVVYSARHHATNRRVAVKVLMERHLASEAARNRFMREIDVVAGLQHPNIVRVYDTGLTTAGRLYLAMEQIDGLPLDVYVRSAAAADAGGGALRVEDVLRLFARICDAVHAAHQRGAIHRDLKPGNILIDARGAPHILDFGLAKFVDSRPTNDAGVTATGEFLGTLAYASPEQLAGQPAQVDVRTDIYSLGVILYELLAGRRPIDPQAPIAEVIRLITQIEPEAPSACLRRLAAVQPPQRRIAGRLDDELDRLVLKALAKSPPRRYQSADSLRQDIERYLAGEPIEAKRDSRGYVLRKTIWKFRLPVAVTAVVLTLSTVFTIATTLSYRRAARAESAARAEAARAGREAAKSATISGFLQELLGSVEPGRQGRDVLVRDILDQAGSQLAAKFGEEPDVQAALHTTIGNGYYGLGFYDQAESHLRQSLELLRSAPQTEPVRLAAGLSDLAAVQASRAKFAEAEALYRQTLAIYRAHLPAEDATCVLAINNLGALLLQAGRHAEAETHYREALAINRARFGTQPNAELALSISHLGGLHYVMKDYVSAESQFREALEMYRATLGPRHPTVAYCVNNVGLALSRLGDHEQAERFLREGHVLRRELLGEDHPDVADSLFNLASLFQATGRRGEAEELCRQALGIQQESLPPDHPAIARSDAFLAQFGSRPRPSGD